ncbi:MAG: SH3 domain-containing protein [Chloroflexota bacterium]
MKRLLTVVMLLCFAAAFATPRAQAQELSDEAFEATISQLNQIIPGIGRPDRWQFQILFPSTDSAVMCPLVPGYKTQNTRQPFIVSLFYGETEYIFHASSDGFAIQPCDPKLGQVGMAQISTVPAAADACTLTPGGGFANIRIQPDIEAQQVFTLEEGRQVLGRNGDTTWYLIAEGWVAGTVVATSGDCSPNVLPERSTDIMLLSATPQVAATGGTGTTIVTPLPGATVVAAAPSDDLAAYTCPPNFEGYLPPRIRAGAVTAQVQLGGFPNTLRSLPTTQSDRVGQVQPGRRLDRVIQGPRCGDGFMWWQIDIDGRVGWTAESSAEDNEYYLEPTPGNEVAVQPAGEVAALPSSVVAITTDNIGLVRQSSVLSGNYNVFAWRGEFDALAALGGLPVPVDVTSINSVAVMPASTGVSGVTAIAVAPDSAIYAQGTDTGAVTVFTEDGDEETALAAAVNAIAFSPDSTRMATGTGDSDGAEDTWTLQLWDVPGMMNGVGENDLLRTIRFPFPVRDVAFSADSNSMAVLAERNGDAALWIYTDGGVGANTLTLLVENTQGYVFVEPVPEGQDGDFIYAKGTALFSMDVATGTERLLYDQNTLLITDVAFNPATPAQMLVTNTSAASPDAPTGSIPLYAYDYSAFAGSTPAPTVVDVTAGVEVSFNEGGSAFAVQTLTGDMRFYAVP